MSVKKLPKTTKFENNKFSVVKYHRVVKGYMTADGISSQDVGDEINVGLTNTSETKIKSKNTKGMSKG